MTGFDRAGPCTRIAGMRVDAVTCLDAVDLVLEAARQRRSDYVCVANVHMVMEAHDDPSFGRVVEDALLVTPDGMPLVWAHRLLGRAPVDRVYGPALTLDVCQAASSAGIPVGLYGGTPESLAEFRRFLEARYPGLDVAVAISPPFRPLTADEDERITREISTSGARILFVGIGCPRQERWMAEHRGRIPAVMLGVGAAFDFHSGRVRQAPAVLQRLGLEWAFRLAMEPRRLWRRYARHNPRFVGLFVRQWWAQLRAPSPDGYGRRRRPESGRPRHGARSVRPVRSMEPGRPVLGPADRMRKDA